MISITAITEHPTKSQIIWAEIEENAKLVKQPTQDFFAGQHRMNTKILREEVGL